MGESGEQIAVEPEAVEVEQNPVVTQEEAKPEVSEKPAENENSEARKPRRGGFQKKIAARDVEIERLKAELARAKPETVTQPKKPRPEDSPTWEEYNEALVEFKANEVADKKLAERDSKTSESNFRKDMQARADLYDERVEKVKETHKDFDEVIEAYDGPLTVQMQQAILESDIGPEISYYLAKNPEEADKLASMSILGMNKAIGRIEATIEGKKGQAVKTTNSPPPITPVRASSKVTEDNPRGYVEVN